MVERFRNLTEEQLNIGIVIMAASSALLLFLFGLLMTTDAGNNLLVAAGLAEDGSVVQPTITPQSAALPPTWTPRPTNTATPTNTPLPTETPPPSPTASPEQSPTPEVSETPEPDFAATIAAAQSATPPPPPPPPTQPPPTPIPPPPVVIQPTPIPPPPVIVPTQPPPTPIPTPLPLFVLADLLGGPNCSYSGIGGTIRAVNGAPLPGVTVEVFNEFGFTLTPVTDVNGRYEAFLDSRPREDLAGPWHIRVLEGGVQVSNEYVVIMSGSCQSGETQFVANFFRTQ